MNYPLPGVLIDPQGVSTSVAITDSHGNTPTVYADRFAVTTITMPDTITARKTYYLPGEGPWTVTPTANGEVTAATTLTLEDAQIATVTVGSAFTAGQWSQLGAYVKVNEAPINVTDYLSAGQTFTSTTDVTTAWQNALAAAASSITGSGEVFGPKGHHKLTARLMPAVGVSILCEGQSATILDFSTLTGDNPIMGPVNNVGALFRGFTLKLASSGVATVPSLNYQAYVSPGNFPAGSPTGVCIGLCPGPYAFACRIEDVIISGGSAALVLSSDKGTRLLNVEFKDAKSHNLVIDSGPGVANAVNDIEGVGVVLSQANSAGSATSTDQVANLYICNHSGAGYDPRRITIEGHFDEPSVSATTPGNNISILAGKDITIKDSTVHHPVGVAGSTRYGVYIASGVDKTTLRIRSEPYVPSDSTRIPTNTIYIASGATNTVLDHVFTDRNTGGDISDSGTGTIWRGVSLTGGPLIDTVATKAGIPSDADYDEAPPIGTWVLDTTDGKIYYRTAAATWKAALLS